MSPSQSHEDVAVQRETGRDSRATMTSQLWHKNGSCPKGTVPIRRAKDKHLPNYGRKRDGSIEQHWLRPNYAVSEYSTFFLFSDFDRISVSAVGNTAHGRICLHWG